MIADSSETVETDSSSSDVAVVVEKLRWPGRQVAFMPSLEEGVIQLTSDAEDKILAQVGIAEGVVRPKTRCCDGGGDTAHL